MRAQTNQEMFAQMQRFGKILGHESCGISISLMLNMKIIISKKSIIFAHDYNGFLDNYIILYDIDILPANMLNIAKYPWRSVHEQAN